MASKTGRCSDLTKDPEASIFSISGTQADRDALAESTYAKRYNNLYSDDQAQLHDRFRVRSGEGRVDLRGQAGLPGEMA